MYFCWNTNTNNKLIILIGKSYQIILNSKFYLSVVLLQDGGVARVLVLLKPALSNYLVVSTNWNKFHIFHSLLSLLELGIFCSLFFNAVFNRDFWNPKGLSINDVISMEEGLRILWRQSLIIDGVLF